MIANNKKALDCKFFAKPSLSAHNVHSLLFHLRTPLPQNSGMRFVPEGQTTF